MTNSEFQIDREIIVNALKSGGIMEVEMYGLTRVIPFLSEILRQNEIIFKSAFGALNKLTGVFVITSERIIFLHEVLQEVHSIEYDIEKVISIDHKKEYPETITIRTENQTIIMEDTRTPFGTDTFNLINSFLN